MTFSVLKRPNANKSMPDGGTIKTYM